MTTGAPPEPTGGPPPLRAELPTPAPQPPKCPRKRKGMGEETPSQRAASPAPRKKSRPPTTPKQKRGGPEGTPLKTTPAQKGTQAAYNKRVKEGQVVMSRTPPPPELPDSPFDPAACTYVTPPARTPKLVETQVRYGVNIKARALARSAVGTGPIFGAKRAREGLLLLPLAKAPTLEYEPLLLLEGAPPDPPPIPSPRDMEVESIDSDVPVMRSERRVTRRNYLDEFYASADVREDRVEMLCVMDDDDVVVDNPACILRVTSGDSSCSDGMDTDHVSLVRVEMPCAMEVEEGDAENFGYYRVSHERNTLDAPVCILRVTSSDSSCSSSMDLSPSPQQSSDDDIGEESGGV